MRVAAVDVGTNSARLLVADVADGRLVDVTRRMEVVRLGEGVDRTGRLSDAALLRTRAALESYASDLRRLGAEAVRVVATSATRDAANRGAFAGLVRDTLGVEPDVVPGEEEAALSFAGATRDLDPADGPFLVVDVGGGSTEVVLGDTAPRAAVSLDVGCVRLRERRLHSDPADPAEVAALVADVEAALDRARAEVPLADARTLVAVAGTATTVAALALGLPAYDAAAIHLSRVTAADVERVTAELVAADRATRAALPVMHPGRVDVIAAGALVLRQVVRAAGLPEVVVSEHDILDGVAWSLVP